MSEGEDHCVKRGAYTGHLFTVEYDSTNNILGSLVLGAPAGSSLTIDGAAEWVGGSTPAANGSDGSPYAQAALIKVEGTLTLNEGAVLQNNYNYTSGDGNGGGVYIDGSSAVFNMTGGKIRNNSSYRSAADGHGGGVFIGGGANFNMSGGEISGNYARCNGGGVDLGSAGHFTMSGGEISQNYAMTYGGGGLYLAEEFTFSGGVIRGNVVGTGLGGGVRTAGAAFKMEGNALVKPDNDLYLNGNVIRITGTLQENPAANINLPSSYIAGTRVLDGTPADIASNYNKFLVNGDADKIDSAGLFTP
ncbi:MAG: hypothetical protein Ta2F_18980 [Termitinemataceae bacterium]|nr:MAG: hypothetical protein Ta2F_18980 [Termitinemataceae bacterium]